MAVCRVSMAAVVVVSEDCCCVLVVSGRCRANWCLWCADCWLAVVVVLRCWGMACSLAS